MKPFLLKLGVAIALSFVGFFYSRIKTPRIQPTPVSPPPPTSSTTTTTTTTPPGDRETDLITSPKDQILPAAASTSALNDIVDGCNQNLKADDHPVTGFSLSNSNHSDQDEEEGLLLPEFEDLLFKDFEITCTNTEAVCPIKEARVPQEMIEEVEKLRNTVQVLRERETSLETRLVELYGLKEQETTVKELHNRLKISAMETKLLNLRIESLKAEKERLEAQVTDHLKVVTELESAREKIKLLKKKIISDEERTKEQLASLRERLACLERQEHIASQDDAYDQCSSRRIKELETELADLGREKLRLVDENSELLKKLESAQNSVLELQEALSLKQANQRLRQENYDLTKEIERLQANRCADVEEVVYLRWINACLRYELRNYQVAPGKTVAKDLSKTLSPRSEEKVKQLILEYANAEGRGDWGNIMDLFDCEDWSSSQDSNLTESGDFDDSSIDFSSASKTHSSRKSKFFSKLRKLVVGKGHHRNEQALLAGRTTGYATSRGGESVSAGSFEEMQGNFATVSGTDLTGIEARMEERRRSIALVDASQNLARGSLDIQRHRHLGVGDIKGEMGVRRNSSDVGFLNYYRTLVSKEDGVDDFLQNTPEKSELNKFAMALKGGSSHKSANPHRRAASYSGGSY